MDAAEVRGKIKEIIANVTSIDPEEIGDSDAFVDDLDLDSLSLLEIGVDIDYEFKLNLPEERMRDLRTVEDAVELVMAHRQELTAAEAEVA